MGVVAWIVGILLIVMMMMAAMMKITGHKMSIEVRDRLSVADGLWKQIGGLELVGGVAVFLGLLSDGGLEWVGLAGAIGIIALTAGAIVYHKRAGDEPKEWIPAGMTMMLAVVYLIAIAAR